MPTTNFNGGVAPWGAVPGVYDMALGRTWFVCNRSGVTAGGGFSADKPLASVADANAAIDTNSPTQGDMVIIGQGHTENITAANTFSGSSVNTSTITLKAGTRYIGQGTGTYRPTFTWTAAASAWNLTVANTTIENCNLFLAGAHAAGSALTVAAPITVSAAGCKLLNNRMFFGFDADQIVTIGITTTAAADDFWFNGNYCRAEVAAATGTTFMQLVGADFMQMNGNYISGASSAVGVGIVRFLTTASLGISWDSNQIQNQLAASASAVTGLAGCTGMVTNCTWGILDNATKAGFTTPANLQFGNCFTVNDNGENGAAMTPVSA